MNGLNYLFASFRKEIHEKMFYRGYFIIETISTLSMLMVFYLINRFYGNQFGQYLTKLNTSYFGYVTLGLAVSELSNTGLGGIIGDLYQEKNQQTLERIMSSPVTLTQWSLISGICHFSQSVFRFFFMLLIAVLFFKLQIPHFNGLAAIVLFVISLVPLWSLGFISLSSTLLFRKGNYVSWFFMTCFRFLGGVYVPLEVLPNWLQSFSEVLPITPIIRSFQSIVYAGATLHQIRHDLSQIMLMSIFYFPVAMILLSLTDRVCRKKGYYSLS